MNNIESFKNKLKEKHNDQIILKGNYINNNTKTIFHCNKCNKDFQTKPMYLTRNKKTCGCPNCYKTKNIKIFDTSSFKDFIKNETNNTYILLSEYKNSNTKVNIKHVVCNKIYKVKPNDFQQGYRCPYCSHGHTKKSNDYFKKEIYDLYKDEYILLSEYKTCKEYVLIKHTTCNNTYTVTPRNFLSNKTRCPYCYKAQFSNLNSKNADYLFDYFKKNNYTVEIEKYFNDLKYKGYLRIDFYLKELNLYIEYDGDQHFKQTSTFVTEEKLKEYKTRDILKNNYFIKNNLNFIRLDRTNFKYIDSLLDDIKNKRSTTIEKYNIYANLDYFKNDNQKYYI